MFLGFSAKNESLSLSTIRVSCIYTKGTFCIIDDRPTAHNTNSTGTEKPGCFACQSQKKIKLGIIHTWYV